MKSPLVACVLAGGTGTRLYPASRSDTPKQLRRFGGDRTLLARTVERARFADAIYVLTRPDLRGAIESALSKVDLPETRVNVLEEPEPKDTGPALVYAAGRIDRDFGTVDPVLLTLPSDHHIGEKEGFAREAREAARVAVDRNRLVTLGIEPTRVATGYGYIEPDDRPARTGSETLFTPVAAFHEKPDEGTAARYVEAGHLWNAGIFAWTPAALFTAARKTALAPLVEAIDRTEQSTAEREPIATAFGEIEPASIDSAVLEPAADRDRVAVVRATFPWDDLGAWDAIERVVEPDEAGNAVLGDALAIDSTGNVVASDEGTTVSVLGVSDLVVAAYGDRVLVVPKEKAQRVREVVEELRTDDRF